MTSLFDLIIIGGGPAGLAAGLYGSRAGLNTLILEKRSPGGQILVTELIENYPGFPEGISGLELAGKMEKQTRRFGLQIKTIEVVSLILQNNQKQIITESHEKLEGKTIIIATGASPAQLGVPGEEKLKGRGVSYCATCDGALFRDKEVAVVGGGDSAIEEAIFLTKFAGRVNVIHRRDKLRAVKALRDRALSNPKITFIWDSHLVKILGEEKVKSIVVRNKKTQKETTLPAEGVFLYVGTQPNTNFLPKTIKTDQQGYVLTNESLQTSVPGVFAAGDVRSKSLKQVVAAAGEGALAATSAYKYIEGFD